MNKQKKFFSLSILCIVIAFMTIVIIVGLSACNPNTQTKPDNAQIGNESTDNSTSENGSSSNTKSVVTFNTDGGTCVDSSAEITYGENFTLAVPTRPGYIFGGWTANNQKITDENGNSIATWQIKGNIIIKAIWTIHYPHTFGEWETITPASCTVNGMQKRICSKCNLEEINNLTGAHTYNEYEQCTECGAGIEYAYDENTDTYSIKNYTGDKDELVIPSEYQNKKVTRIANSAFSNCTTLYSIKIPIGVTDIGSGAFYGCSKLHDIVIPDSIIKIGGNAFYKTRWYEIQWNGFIHLDNWLIGYKGDIPKNASIVLTDKTQNIADQAFLGCTNLKSITIPNSVTSIGSETFRNCSGLTSVTLSEGLKDIGDSAFSGCTGINSLTIPKSVTTIGGSTFSECTGLVNINIPNSVTSIGSGAFTACIALGAVYIPNSVKYIGANAFYACSNLKTIYCQATSKPSGWDTNWNVAGRYNSSGNWVNTYKRVEWGCSL